MGVSLFLSLSGLTLSNQASAGEEDPSWLEYNPRAPFSAQPVADAVAPMFGMAGILVAVGKATFAGLGYAAGTAATLGTGVDYIAWRVVADEVLGDNGHYKIVKRHLDPSNRNYRVYDSTNSKVSYSFENYDAAVNFVRDADNHSSASAAR